MKYIGKVKDVVNGIQTSVVNTASIMYKSVRYLPRNIKMLRSEGIHIKLVVRLITIVILLALAIATLMYQLTHDVNTFDYELVMPVVKITFGVMFVNYIVSQHLFNTSTARLHKIQDSEGNITDLNLVDYQDKLDSELHTFAGKLIDNIVLGVDEKGDDIDITDVALLYSKLIGSTSEWTVNTKITGD